MDQPSLFSNRRQFINRSALALAAIGAPSAIAITEPPAKKFGLKFAPHPGSFKAHAGDEVVAQIRYAAAQGFTAWEDNGLPGRPVAEQEMIGETLAALEMEMGVFVGYGSFDEPVFARADHPKRGEVVEQMKRAVEVCKRVGAKYFTVVPGSIDQQGNSGRWNAYGGKRLREGVQTANAIELLRQCAEVLEPAEVVMVLEPLNWATDHGGVYVHSTDQAYALCKAVNSPACKILYDIYHEQITAGNIINTFDQCRDEIAYLQVGDNPGRKEPGTGEINYSKVFEHIARKAPEMIIGMEHGNSIDGKKGEDALVAAYRAVDPTSRCILDEVVDLKMFILSKPCMVTDKSTASAVRFRLALLLALVCLLTGLVAKGESNSFDWDYVNIGGGGYITGIIPHPSERGLIYARTDVGGALRWDPEKERWDNLLNGYLLPGEANLFGVESIALDPAFPEVIYMACGRDQWEDPLNSDILKSQDRGKTWTRLGFNKLIIGNGDKRWIGERLVVDPAISPTTTSNNRRLFLGTRDDGLWMSENSGQTWQVVSSFPY